MINAFHKLTGQTQPQSGLIWPHICDFYLRFSFFVFPTLHPAIISTTICSSFILPLDFLLCFHFNDSITIFHTYYELFYDMDIMQRLCPHCDDKLCVNSLGSKKELIILCSVWLCINGANLHAATARLYCTSLIFSMPLVKM